VHQISGDICDLLVFKIDVLFNRSRVFLVCWCPDTARIKKKMLYSASFDSVKKAFKGISTIIQANGSDDIDEVIF